MWYLGVVWGVVFSNGVVNHYLGKQLYSDKYKNLERLAEMGMDRPPKWNFTDFIFSFLMVCITYLSTQLLSLPFPSFLLQCLIIYDDILILY